MSGKESVSVMNALLRQESIRRTGFYAKKEKESVQTVYNSSTEVGEHRSVCEPWLDEDISLHLSSLTGMERGEASARRTT